MKPTEWIDVDTIYAYGFLALYADIRGWGTSNAKKSAIQKSIRQATTPRMQEQDDTLVEALLLERKFVVLQGAPGTGKTRMSKKVAKSLDSITFFTQFHAETSYSDFVWGIRPSLETDLIKYHSKDGILIEAIKAALNNPSKKVVLIIDEINRANLANVLGPVFYLFELAMDTSEIEFSITHDLTINQLPQNFYVIATMNTADRSLAVVDFALRRRFAWYTLWPKSLTGTNFYNQYFERIERIFEKNASEEELSLQPGQSYFLANNEEQMKNRLRFELLPLIKEYLAEGLMSTSKSEFAEFFQDTIQEVLYR